MMMTMNILKCWQICRKNSFLCNDTLRIGLYTIDLDKKLNITQWAYTNYKPKLPKDHFT